MCYRIIEVTLCKSKTSEYWIGNVPSLDISSHGASQNEARENTLEAIKEVVEAIISYGKTDIQEGFEIIDIDWKDDKFLVLFKDEEVYSELRYHRKGTRRPLELPLPDLEGCEFPYKAVMDVVTFHHTLVYLKDVPRGYLLNSESVSNYTC